MASLGQVVNLGPFTGGLNNVHDPSHIQDNELQELVNFEIDTDGSLRSRPPIQEIAGPTGTGAPGSATAMRAFCTGVFSRGATPSAGHVFFSTNAGVWVYDSTGTWTLIANNTDLPSQYAGVQYEDKMWFFNNPTFGAAIGGTWDPTSGWLTDLSLPEGKAALVYKDRIWIARGSYVNSLSSRLFFSGRNASGVINWPSTNFIDVSPGDGQNIVDLAVVDDNLLIFKEDSTYVFGYDAEPADAILRCINTEVGVAQQNCVVQWRNSTFVYHDKSVYEIVDYQFNKLNDNVIFNTSDNLPFLSVLGDRLIVRADINEMYAFNLITRTWSKFESNNTALNSVGYILPLYKQTEANDRITQYIGGEYYAIASPGRRAFRWYENVLNGRKEQTVSGTTVKIQCTTKTKDFGFDVFHAWKRLFWWGAEIYGKGSDPSYDHYGEVTPVGYSAQRTDFDLPSNSDSRFVKLKKSIRFRKVNFKVRLETEGDNYVRLFSIVPTIRAPKEVVVKQVNS